MLAIINVEKLSIYAKYRGHTFNVESISDTAISLIIEKNVVTFAHKEVFIISIHNEMDSAYKEYILDDKNYTYKFLMNYLKNNKIKL